MPRVLRPDCSLEVTVQPIESLRFRFESETIKAKLRGANREGWPMITVNNFIGRGKLYVCVVTVPESPGERPKVHPYRLAGPYTDGNNGFYERDIEIDEAQNTFELKDLSLVRRPKNRMGARFQQEPLADEWACEIQQRKRNGMDPFKAGFDHAENTDTINPSKVALAFFLIVKDDKNRYRPLCRPVASNAIVDYEEKDPLEISSISPKFGSAEKEDVMFMLVGGLQARNVNGVWMSPWGERLDNILKVRFYSEQVQWESWGNFNNTHFHGTEKVCSAIRLAYPRYMNPGCTQSQIKVSVELLLKLGIGSVTRSAPVSFIYHQQPSNGTDVAYLRRAWISMLPSKRRAEGDSSVGVTSRRLLRLNNGIQTSMASIFVDDYIQEEPLTVLDPMVTHIEPQCEPLSRLDPMVADMDTEIGLSPLPTTADEIKALYYNSEKVYKMSPGKRGRALIISNKYDSHPRPGSEHDYNKLKKMLVDFNFEVVGSHKNYDAQEIHDEIENESRHQDHKNYGMFVLAVLSHGYNEKVFGNDDYSIKISDIKGLLSETKFPAMGGKPKLVLISACRGVLQEGLAEQGGGDVPRGKLGNPQSYVDKKAIIVKTPYQTFEDDGKVLAQPSTGSYSMEHLMVMMASQQGYPSLRLPKKGSFFIHTLVVMFYKYAHEADLETLAKYVQEQCRLLTKSRSENKNKALGQIPDPSCTFSRGRKVYLFPGYHGN